MDEDFFICGDILEFELRSLTIDLTQTEGAKTENFNRTKYAAPHLAMLVKIHRLELAISAVCIGTVDSMRTQRLGYRLHATRSSD